MSNPTMIAIRRISQRDDDRLYKEADKAHREEIAAWLASRPEVGVLVGKTDRYYIFNSAGVFTNIGEFEI